MLTFCGHGVDSALHVKFKFCQLNMKKTINQ